MKTEHLIGRSRADASQNSAAGELGWQVVSPTPPPLKQIDINDTALAYTEQGKGELVIFVHGALGDCRTWSRQVALLAQHYHVISYSRRYHHVNPAPPGPIDYSYRRHVDDLISFIRALGLGPAHLVGHSYGATVAALVAMERPEMVSSLVLGESTFFSILTDYQDIVSLTLHRIALGVVRKLAETDEQGLALREYLKIVVGRDVFDELSLQDLLVISQNAATLGPMLRTYFEPTSLDHSSAQTLKTPTLLFTGELSPAIYRAITRELNDCLPNADILSLPEASHGLQMEKPEIFGTALMDFLATTKGADGKNC